ncbi:hypothetical protein [Psychrobacter sp. GW64-MNA-CIBAN-0177]
MLKRARQKDVTGVINHDELDVEGPLIRSINALAAGLRNTG